MQAGFYHQLLINKMEKETQIEVLNTLITINHDRIEGYETASKETEEHDLKSLFSELAGTSKKANIELVAEVSKLGGKPAEGTLVSGKFFRVWMDVKSALTGKNRKVVLDSCEYGEDVAKNTYQKALEHNAEKLSAEQKNMLKSQHTLLIADHDRIKSLRDAAAAHKV